MSISQISIANSALVKVGAERISSIDEDNKRAKIIKSIWDESRDAALRAHPWHFAKKRVVLFPVSTPPAWGYTYQFDEPNDCLKVLGVDPDTIDFILENSRILANCSTLNVQYTYRHTDWSKWDSMFAEAFSWQIASTIAYALSQSATLSQLCDKKFDAVLAEARSANGSEGVLKGIEADTWTSSRRRG